MNRTLIVAAALALGFVGPAAAKRTVEQPEGSYELVLRDVVLPRSTAGYVIFKPCADCDSLSLAVTASTGYAVDGTPLPFADFLAAAEGFRGMSGGDENTAVYVFYDLASKRVNRLALDHFGS